MPDFVQYLGQDFGPHFTGNALNQDPKYLNRCSAGFQQSMSSLQNLRFPETIMAGKPGAVSELPTRLPARYERNARWSGIAAA
jgi:hypothetical protein